MKIVLDPLIKNNMKIQFVDFDDSFSFNIVDLLKSYSLDVEVVHWSKFDPAHCQSLIVLGPGPGHPEDYPTLALLKKKNYSNETQFLGICLGHQILGMSLGLSLVKLPSPIHGRSLEVHLPDWKVFNLGIRNKMVNLQFYNSWALKDEKGIAPLKVERNDWVVAFQKNNYLGFQFHPESVGTSNSHSFFDRKWFSPYNIQDERPISPGRHI